jgi:hypothetical protein
MEQIEKFIKESYSPSIGETSKGITCTLKHNDSLTDNVIIYFEFTDKKLSKKEDKYLIVDTNITDLLEFLSKYYNITEDNHNKVRKIIINMGIESLDKFYGN